MSAIIRKAQGDDIKRVKSFAAESGVSTKGIRASLDCFYMMEDEEGRLMTVAGIERLDGSGVLRALVIDSETCQMDDVIRFFTTIVTEAEKQHLEALFFMTPSPDIFEPLGFTKMETEEIPEHLKEAADHHAEATVMARRF
jgi:N-acetylglutamate synthase-like GNAT family acetyltransferase